MLKLGWRSYGDSMEGAVWKELEGMEGMNGMDGMDGMDGMEFRAKIQLFSDTAKFGGVIRICLKCAFRLKVVKLPYS